jgi:carotenoid cleavage dioxygenase-like enzyme
LLLLLPLQVAYIPDRHWLTPAWMHDFACTDKYAVLIEQPLYMVSSDGSCRLGSAVVALHPHMAPGKTHFLHSPACTALHLGAPGLPNDVGLSHSCDQCRLLLCAPQDFLSMFLGRDNGAVWMRWRPQEDTRLHLITLDGSKVGDHVEKLTSSPA